jgi:hypothetical protein
VRRLIQVMQESWNHLILLDACRYDVFAQCWNRFFPAGRLECGDSIGTATVEWRDRSFPNQYPDVVYVSSNPYINSRKPALGFFAPDHFHAIVDVWATDWDSTAGTVYPDKVTRAALRAHRDFPDKRLIVHYIQPHAPYISQAGSLPGFPAPNVDNGNILVGIPDMSAETPRQRKWFRRFLPIVDAFLPEPASWSLAQWLGMPPRSGPTGASAGLSGQPRSRFERSHWFGRVPSRPHRHHRRPRRTARRVGQLQSQGRLFQPLFAADSLAGHRSSPQVAHGPASSTRTPEFAVP